MARILAVAERFLEVARTNREMQLLRDLTANIVLLYASDSHITRCLDSCKGFPECLSKSMLLLHRDIHRGTLLLAKPSLA